MRTLYKTIHYYNVNMHYKTETQTDHHGGLGEKY